MAGENYFDPIVIGDNTYTFAHLSPFTMRFASLSARRELRVNVTFSNHCFSFSPEDNIVYPNSHHLLDQGGKPRIFCPIRYRLSKDLPELVRSLNNDKCYVWETKTRRNYNYSLEIVDPFGPYHLFMKVSRSTNLRLQEVSVFIESAYHEDPEKGSPEVVGRIKFHTLCSNMYLNRKTSTRR